MRSIGLKLWSGMMILVLVVLILLWLFQIVFLERVYTDMRIGEVKSTGYSIIKEFDNIVGEDIKNTLDAFSYNNNLSVEMLDIEGNTVYESAAAVSGNTPMMRNNVRYDALNEVLEGKDVVISLTHPRFGNKFIFIGIPVSILGQIQGVLFINMPLAPVEDTAAILKKQLLYIIAILLAVSLIISFFISKTFTKPILEINKVSEKIALGDFSQRLQPKSKDEIGKLAVTINYMGQQLSKIEQLRKDLIANISHELRTPLSLIRGYAETIRDVSGNIADKRQKQLQIIVEESKRLSNIVDDILKLSQMEAGYIQLKINNFSIRNSIDRVVKRYNILCEETSIAIVVKGTGNSLVYADEKRIEQVLYNLINNAFDHTAEGGRITVNLFDEDTSVKVEIADTGTGIPKEDIEHIWDRYYKTDKTIGKKTVGTGLGLAIVKGILEAHNASFGVESSKGVGTTFWFKLKK